MNWIPYDGQELKKGKDYLVCTQEEVNIVIFTKPSNWKFIGVTAYTELPKPYEKPKSLKERLDEAVEKYCYEFSDEEWKLQETKKYVIYYDWFSEEFEIYGNAFCAHFTIYYFNSHSQTKKFIDSFTTEELMKIMKGEV